MQEKLASAADQYKEYVAAEVIMAPANTAVNQAQTLTMAYMLRWL